MGVKNNANRVLMGKAERKRPLGRTMHRWDGNINMFLRWVCRVWTASLWLSIGTGRGVFNLVDKPWGSIKCREFPD
jgi:hypothetical protein